MFVTFLQRNDTACIDMQYAISGLRQESGTGITAAMISALHVCRCTAAAANRV